MEASPTITGEITLSVAGTPVRLEVTVPARAVKPQAMLPTFQKMANAFTDMAVGAVHARGEEISCRKGCGACCRQPVPLTEVEIYYIALLVDSLPEPRRTEVRGRFSAAAAKFHSIGWYEHFAACKEEDALKVAVLEYFYQGVACPFLVEESCSIHTLRPVACREYLVTSPAKNCSDPVEETICQVPYPIKAADGLTKLAPTGNLSSKNFLPMVFALEWAAQHPEAFPLKTGEEWLADFFSAGEE